MNKLSKILLLAGFLTGCITGNPWEQFLGNIQGFVGEDFGVVKQQLERAGRHEVTTNDGYLLPNGNRQHEFWWRGKTEKCFLLLEVDPTTNQVISVGGKGATKECQWGG